MSIMCDWSGHVFDVYDPYATTWNDVGGIYVFARHYGWGAWALYIGKTGSFKERPLGTGHERWWDAVRAGATHIHAMPVFDETSRRWIESRLIRDHTPPLNRQLVPRGGLSLLQLGRSLAHRLADVGWSA